jgi:transcription elongation factor Elf1
MAEPQADATTPGRIPCPDCGEALALPVAAVLSGQPIVCAACGLELQVKREDSAEALAALGRWYGETAPARAAASASAAAPRPSSVSRRRPRR